MVQADVSRSKSLHKILIILLKIIPCLLALCEIVNMVFAFVGINASIPSIVGGISFLPLLFLYLASYAFSFCEYHRMFLHYVLTVNLLNIFDLYVGIPISITGLFTVHCILVGLLLFAVLYFYKKEKCCRR